MSKFILFVFFTVLTELYSVYCSVYLQRHKMSRWWHTFITFHLSCTPTVSLKNQFSVTRVFMILLKHSVLHHYFNILAKRSPRKGFQNERRLLPVYDLFSGKTE